MAPAAALWTVGLITMDKARQILVGIVGAAQGVRGEVRVKSFTGDPAALAGYGPLATGGSTRPLDVLALRALKDDMVVVQFAGIADRDAAASLTGTKLYVDRDRLPPPDEDEVYHVDLIGLRAVTEDGARVGEVVAVQNFGAGDLLEIAPDRGQSLLVPFTKAFVPILDFAGGRLIVSPGALADEDAAGATDQNEPRS